MPSVVVPVYNEGKNVFELTERLTHIFEGPNSETRPFEILFVDDSTDETSALLDELASSDAGHVRVFHRPGERGLASAVVLGIRHASYPLVAVMDSDLQHPPEVLSLLLEQLESGADLVVASRFVNGGDDGGMSFFRRHCSRAARFFVHALLPSLRGVRDVTAGFFAFRKELVEGVELDPVGWKILIEILVRARPSRVVEVPYSFGTRGCGKSKLSARDTLACVRHVLGLRRSA